MEEEIKDHEEKKEKKPFKQTLIELASKKSSRDLALIVLLLITTVFLSLELNRANNQLLDIAAQMNERLRLNNELVKRGATLRFTIQELDRIGKENSTSSVPFPPIASYVRSYSPTFKAFDIEYSEERFVLWVTEEGKGPLAFPLTTLTDKYAEAKNVDSSDERQVIGIDVQGDSTHSWIYFRYCLSGGKCYGDMYRVDLVTGKETEIYSTYITENSIPGRDTGPLLYVTFGGTGDVIAQCDRIQLNHFPIKDLILTNCETIHVVQNYASSDDSGTVKLYYDQRGNQILPELVASLVEGDLHLRFNNLINQNQSISMYSVPKSRLGKSSVLVLPR